MIFCPRHMKVNRNIASFGDYLGNICRELVHLSLGAITVFRLVPCPAPPKNNKITSQCRNASMFTLDEIPL